MGAENVVTVVIQGDNRLKPTLDEAKADSESAAEGMDAYAAATDKATEAQARFDDAQKEQADAAARVAELEKGEAGSADELAASQKRLTEASLASADARKKLASAESDVAAKTKVASDEQVASGLKQDESAGLMAGAGGKVKTAFLGIAVGAGYAIDSAMKYDEQSTALVTGAGELDKNLGMVKKGMLDVSTQTATSTSQVQSGMYMIESAGYHGADGLKVLLAAAQGAKVGNADLGAVADATTTVLTDYSMKSTDAASATSGLVAIMAAGKTHMQDLASSMSKVLPTAAALHVGFAEVGGAMATLTYQGITAKLSAMGLNSTLLALAAPSAKASGEMDVLGMGEKKAAEYADLMANGHKKAAAAMVGVGGTSKEVANTLTHQGLVEAMRQVADLALNAGPRGSAAYVAALKTMVGGNRGLQVALGLTGSHLDDFGSKVASVSNAMVTGSKNVQGWDKVQEDAAFRLEKTKQAALNTATAFGEAMMPAVTDILGPLSQFLGFIAQSSAASTAFAAVIGGVLSVYLGSKLVNAFGDVREAGERLFGEEGLLTKIGPALSSIGSGLSSAASSVASFVAETAQGMARAAAATAAWIAEHAVATAEFIAQNIAMAASAMAAFVAENLATLGIIAGIALLVAAIVYLATHWKQCWGDIKNWALDAWHFIDNDVIHPIEHGIGDLVGWIGSHWKLLATILATVLLGPVGFLVAFLATHWNTVRKDVSSLVNDVVSFFRSLPGRIVSALSNLGSMMFNAGVHAIESLINGITSMIGSVGSVMGNIAGKIAGFIGLSPAKEGPLSGGGAPEIRGSHIAADIAKGMMSGHSAVAGAAQHLAGAAAIGSSGAGSGAAGAASGGQITLQIQAGGGGSGLDGLFMQWLKNNVRVSGGDPRIFNKKVQFV